MDQLKTELITVEFTEGQAEVLSLLVNRIEWTELRRITAGMGCDEADQMLVALWQVRQLLEVVGYGLRSLT